MKKEDFDVITEEHIQIAEKILDLKGRCDFVEYCIRCPFCALNSTLKIEDYGLYSNIPNRQNESAKLVESAKNFLKLAKDETSPKDNETLKYKTSNPIINEKLKNGDKEVEKIIEKTFEVFKDNVNSPNHYKLEGLNCETIDVVKARLGKEGFKSFCVGNILKYILRAEKKNGLEDYKKARKYLDWLIEREEK